MSSQDELASIVGALRKLQLEQGCRTDDPAVHSSVRSQERPLSPNQEHRPCPRTGALPSPSDRPAIVLLQPGPQCNRRVASHRGQFAGPSMDQPGGPNPLAIGSPVPLPPRLRDPCGGAAGMVEGSPFAIPLHCGPRGTRDSSAGRFSSPKRTGVTSFVSTCTTSTLIALGGTPNTRRWLSFYRCSSQECG